MNNELERKSFYLSEEEIKQFHKDGFIGPFTLCEPEEMKENWKDIRRSLMDNSLAIYSNANAQSGATNISNYDRHFDVPALGDHLCHPQIVDRVNSLLGNDTICWRSEFFPKNKGDEGTDWHQASTFANASGKPQIEWPEEDLKNHQGGTITVWTAFTDSTLKNGCLQLMPGTHKEMNYDESLSMGYIPDEINSIEKEGVQRGFFGYDYRQLQKDKDWKPDESKAFPVVMKAGQFLIFWSTLMHASLPHTSVLKDMRMGFVGRYVPTRVKVYPDTKILKEYGGEVDLNKYGAVMVSGKDEYGYNTIKAADVYGNPFPRKR
jgi:non-heme Fe2+,alpha-ketoglutarate-dependent halogenase